MGNLNWMIIYTKNRRNGHKIMFIHFLKCSSHSRKGDKQIKVFEIQSKWWSLFYVNSIFMILFLLANFYVFKTSIPSLHFRYALSTIAPAGIVHTLVAPNNKD